MKPETHSLLQKAHENCEAAALLLQNGYADIAAFGRDFAKTAALDPRFHRYLIDAQDLRQSGDYDTNAAVTPAQVEQALHWANDFLAAAQALLT